MGDQPEARQEMSQLMRLEAGPGIARLRRPERRPRTLKGWADLGDLGLRQAWHHSLGLPVFDEPRSSRRKGQVYSARKVLETTNRYNENDGVSKRVHEPVSYSVLVAKVISGPELEPRLTIEAQTAATVT